MQMATKKTTGRTTYSEGHWLEFMEGEFVHVAVIDHDQEVDVRILPTNREKLSNEMKERINTLVNEAVDAGPEYFSYQHFRDTLDLARKEKKDLRKFVALDLIDRNKAPLHYWMAYVKGVETMAFDPWEQFVVDARDRGEAPNVEEFAWRISPNNPRGLPPSETEPEELESEQGEEERPSESSEAKPKKGPESPPEKKSSGSHADTVVPTAEFPDDDSDFWKMFRGRHELFGAGRAAEMAATWLASKSGKGKRRCIIACISFTEKPARFLILGQVGKEGEVKDAADEELSHYLPTLSDQEYENITDKEGFNRRRSMWGAFNRINLSRIRIIAYAAMQVNWMSSHKVFQQLRKHYSTPPLTWNGDNAAFKRMNEQTRNIKLQGVDIFKTMWRVIEGRSDHRSVFGL